MKARTLINRSKKTSVPNNDITVVNNVDFQVQGTSNQSVSFSHGEEPINIPVVSPVLPSSSSFTTTSVDISTPLITNTHKVFRKLPNRSEEKLHNTLLNNFEKKRLTRSTSYILGISSLSSKCKEIKCSSYKVIDATILNQHLVAMRCPSCKHYISEMELYERPNSKRGLAEK